MLLTLPSAETMRDCRDGSRFSGNLAYSASVLRVQSATQPIARSHGRCSASPKRLLSYPVTSIPETVSIDTQVFVATAFGFTGKSFEALRAHFASGRLRLVMTDITVREVHARIRQSVIDELVHQRSFINKAGALFNCSIPEVKTSLVKLDENIVAKNLSDQFDAFLKETKATIIETESLTIGDVFNKFFTGDAPFGSTEKKRHEFPDAFSIEALAKWADERDLQMFVVSGDKLFQDACSVLPPLIPKKTIAELLDHVASDDIQLAGFARAETLKRIKEIGERAKVEFEDRYYWVDDEDGDAQVKVTEITVAEEPEIIEIANDEAVLQMSFNAKYSAFLSYNDSGTAIYDREDGKVYYGDRKEEQVERETGLVVEVRASYERLDPKSFEIMDISLTQPPDGFGIETDFNYGWPWK